MYTTTENGICMTIEQSGLNTTYTNIATQKTIYVRVQMTRVSRRKVLATRYIDGVAQEPTLFFIDKRWGMRPHYGLNFVPSQQAALERVQYYSDRVVARLFEEVADGLSRLPDRV